MFLNIVTLSVRSSIELRVVTVHVAMLSNRMLSVTMKCFIMLSVMMLCVLVLNVVAPLAASENVGSHLVLEPQPFLLFLFQVYFKFHHNRAKRKNKVRRQLQVLF
jgi:hypothetical protein